MACFTLVIVATVAPLALVTLGSCEPSAAKAAASQFVTAHYLCALEIAVTIYKDSQKKPKHNYLEVSTHILPSTFSRFIVIIIIITM